MNVSREARVTIAAVAVGVAAMAVDHLVGTEAEPGEDDSFPVDPAAFVLSAATIAVLAVGLFALVVRRAEGDEPGRIGTKGIVCSLLAVLTIPVLFLGVPFPLAGVGIALGLRSRDASGGRRATAAVVIGALVIAFATVAYTVALIA